MSYEIRDYVLKYPWVFIEMFVDVLFVVLISKRK